MVISVDPFGNGILIPGYLDRAGDIIFTLTVNFLTLQATAMENISAVIITYNEERNIGRCIESLLPVAGEIIVVDSNSTDSTVAICSAYKQVRLITHSFEGYIEQKNFARMQAEPGWVLSLDADEALSAQLQDSILKISSSEPYDGYTMNRLTNYCGNWIRHSGWYPDRKLRLFKRDSGRWGGINPHDRFILNSGFKSGHLQGDLLHYSYYSVDEHEQQVRKFADIAARAMYDRGVKSGLLKLYYKPLARFIKSYLLQLGFLDGKDGFTIAKMTALASYLRYSRLHNLRNRK